jgi:hypothetical protein
VAREPLTEIAHRALTVVQDRCQREGLDLFEELNRVGLIATVPRIQEIQRSALANLYDKFQEIQPAAFMNWRPGTPDEMHRAIRGWIRAYLTQFD